MKTLRIIAPLALLLAACGGNPMMDEATGENSGKGGAGAAAAGGAGGTSAGTGGALGDQQGGAAGAATGGAPAGTGGSSAGAGGQGGQDATGGAGAGAGGTQATGGATGGGETGGTGGSAAGGAGAGGAGGDPNIPWCPVPAGFTVERCGYLGASGAWNDKVKDGLRCVICHAGSALKTGCLADYPQEGDMGGPAICVGGCAQCCFAKAGPSCSSDADCCSPLRCKDNGVGKTKTCG